MRNNSFEISVILPVYNGSRYLKESIYSVLQQDLNNFEFIVCDDCSTDDSLAIIKKISYENPGKIIILENEVNKGLFGTLNILIEKSSTNLIHLWSQDDIMKPDCLTNCKLFHNRYPFISMSYHGVEYIDNDSKQIKDIKNDGTPEIISSHLYANISIRWGCIPGNISNVTLNRFFLKKTGIFNDKMIVSGDFDLWTRLASISSIGKNNSTLIYLRIHQEQLSRSFKSIYLRVKEDIPIHSQIITMLSENDQIKALRWWNWKTQVSYYNDYIFLKRKGLPLEAKKLHNLLQQNFNLYSLFIKWLIIRILRLIKLEIGFYKKILNR
ncbi:glycosyltransferase family 2 protein [Pedobacter ginsengiterrae]|uniref:Glycosyltransferase family 2 protein n=1 Tax=Pedobacter ginsengiterrae TaxID=871696 RepID=A0ABP7NY37_9SPHI